MTTPSPFRRFSDVVVHVDDPLVAARDWSIACGVAVSFGPDGARLSLGDASLLLTTGAGSGITSVAVVVDHPDAVAAHAAEAGATVTEGVDGRPVLGLSGLGVELGTSASDAGASLPSPFVRVHHVVVAVRDDDEAIATWRRAVPFSPAPEGPDGLIFRHHVPVGDAWFGLTSAGTDAGAVGRFVERRGEGAYALALVVDDVAAFAAGVEERGGRTIGQPGQGQVFLHPSTTHGVLVELAPEWPGGVRRPPAPSS